MACQKVPVFTKCIDQMTGGISPWCSMSRRTCRSRGASPAPSWRKCGGDGSLRGPDCRAAARSRARHVAQYRAPLCLRWRGEAECATGVRVLRRRGALHVGTAAAQDGLIRCGEFSDAEPSLPISGDVSEPSPPRWRGEGRRAPRVARQDPILMRRGSAFGCFGMRISSTPLRPLAWTRSESTMSGSTNRRWNGPWPRSTRVRVSVASGESAR